MLPAAALLVCYQSLRDWYVTSHCATGMLPITAVLPCYQGIGMAQSLGGGEGAKGGIPPPLLPTLPTGERPARLVAFVKSRAAASARLEHRRARRLSSTGLKIYRQGAVQCGLYPPLRPAEVRLANTLRRGRDGRGRVRGRVRVDAGVVRSSAEG